VNYDPCIHKFQGILCFEGRVVQIMVSSLSWTGLIPQSLTRLQRLWIMDLSGNQLVVASININQSSNPMMQHPTNISYAVPSLHRIRDSYLIAGDDPDVIDRCIALFDGLARVGIVNINQS
jgi:hypothetical protein